MKFKLSLMTLSGAAALSISNVNAQNYEDALRYSNLTTGTTARSMAIGGAAGSLGADYSAAAVNPAGLGVYRQSELTITPYLNFNGTSSKYIDNSNTADNNTAFKLGSIGLVSTTNMRGRSRWKSVTFALGFNKLADFNTHSTYQGVNNQSSFSEVMAAEAQRNGTNEADGAMGFLGYEGYLLTNDLRSIPYRNVLAPGGTLKQTKYNQSKGAVNEFNLSLAGNYDDKFMIGGTLGITSYRFRRKTEFVEADNSGNLNNDFDYFSLIEDLQTNGVGINGKFGFIYAPVQSFRVGLSVHTPTFGSYTDYVDYDLLSEMEGLGRHNVVPQNLYRSDYSITTPMRAIVSATGFIGTRGFITADVEYVPYNTMRIRYEGTGVSEYERAQNDYIKSTFRSAINGRIGAEVRATKDLAVRIGGAYYANPYKDGVNDLGGDRIDLSAGIGYKLGANTTLDLTYLRSEQTYKDSPYRFTNPDPANPITFYDASIKNTRNMVALTLGLRF
ncbi:MAG: hypothetical protein BGO31_18575 [Bacteroidetes bacterium 43-16]|nr:MAG: hypothetical protein BGO31_18575 [Bacteroidetes bacterium 43-16]